MLPVFGKKAVLEWCMCERRFDWIIVCMSEMWKKYGIERKNGQLALEVINDISYQALIIYTDGSRSDTGRAESDMFSNTTGNDVKISIRNPDHCFVFRSELGALSVIFSTLIRTVSGPL
ncbi:hypothetical protein TNCV_624261 [Trichonephila clavipes]|nr:hypothetical protein TNCV_624261 [Trichonephila clavipes]